MRQSVFADLELAAARDRAAAEHKLLLIDATAEWCGPCKMMDRTTWVDPEVITWLHDHALAIQIDVDAQQDVARELRIEAMPTMIVYVDGTEFDRVVGAKNPKDLIAWLDGVTRGETALTAQRRRAAAAPADMRTRLELASALTRNGRYDEAVAEHVWLWQHMLEYQPSMIGVRMSFFASNLERLVAVYPPARAAIEALRDQAAPSSPIVAAMLRDWDCLNGVLGEKARTLAWYDALPIEARSMPEHLIIPLLIEANRWADAGALYGEPIKTLERVADMLAREHPPEVVDHLRAHFRTTAGQLVRALRAANRGADAAAVEVRARELDPSKEMALSLGSTP